MLAGLIFAREDTDDPASPLRACLPLAGRPLIDVQAARLRAAGCRRLFVVAARVPPELSAAIDRIGRGGIATELVRDAAELSTRLGQDDGVLVVADGTLPEERLLHRIAAMPAPTLAITGDGGHRPAIERIDAVHHWAGVALVDAALIRGTLAILGDWELQSTLLRRAVQAGARLLPPDEDDRAPDIRLIDAAATAERIASERIGLAGRAGGPVLDSIARRFLAAPLVDLAQRQRIGRGVSVVVAGGMALVAMAGLSAGWARAGAALLLLAAVLALASVLRAEVEDAPGEAERADQVARAAVPLAIINAAWGLEQVPWTLAIAAIALLAIGERAQMRVLPWAPTPLSVAVLLLAGAATGGLLWGLIAIALHALAALAAAVERLRDA